MNEPTSAETIERARRKNNALFWLNIVASAWNAASYRETGDRVYFFFAVLCFFLAVGCQD